MIEKLLNPEVQSFIKAHLNDDPVGLMLQLGKYPHLPMLEIANQIKARQRLKKKLPEWISNENIIFPHSLSQEQSSSQKTAEYKAQIFNGKSMADLTGGSGVDSWYFSKVFSRVDYIEPNKDLFDITSYNLAVLKATNINFYHEKAEDYLNRKIFVDLIYIDPDRRGNHNKKLVLLSDCEPDVTQLLQIVWDKTEAMLIKTSPMLDITASVRVLGTVESIHVVAIENEVKEVLYLLKKRPSVDIKVKTINFSHRGPAQKFDFYYNNEQLVKPSFSLPKNYLYQPNAAILKAGAFNIISQEFNCAKLQSNTHLYTSDKLLRGFPGRVFKIREIMPFQKKALIKAIPEKKANITARNFPVSVEAIRKKTGIKDGGNDYLFATTNLENKAIMILCEKCIEA
ncbi:MAG: hypothetical protein M3512_01700 [Bacteroidota bacterium]|nr:hypothetical protein [Bacteroidota bacterium]